MVSRIAVGPHERVLDVATGTAAVAREIAKENGTRVVGLDQSAEMLTGAVEALQQHGLTDRVTLVRGQAERLPFPDESFDAVTFTYLLRYVDDPAATLRELVRVVRRGGMVAGLEFGIPRGVWRPLWEVYVRALLPLAGRLISPGWARVGGFLGDNIRDFYGRWPEERLLTAWSRAGIADVRTQRLSLGGGVVTWGRRR
jgi:demethylmenaquinone methyltransferase/2-methoxy-6-polyprenyl-1,4-benzoquinol methylase